MAKKTSKKEKKLYFFEGRNTGVVATSAEEARGKCKRGCGKLVKTQALSASDKKAVAKDRWVRTRRDGKSPEKSKHGKGRGYGPPRKKK